MDPLDRLEQDDSEALATQRFIHCQNCGLALTDEQDSPYRFCPHCADEAQDVNEVIPFEEWKPF